MYPCSKCQKNVRKNQDAILCASCNTWSHACLHLSRTSFLYYINEPNIDWICYVCALPPLSDYFLLNNSTHEVNTTQESDVNISTIETQVNAQDYDQEMDIILYNVYLETIRKHAKKDILLCHININSIQNKFEELLTVMKKLSAHILMHLFIVLNKLLFSINQLNIH